MKASVIIPTFNESENIQAIIKELHNVLKSGFDHEILVVDDDSPDKTWKIAGEIDKKYNVRVIRRTKDKGLSQSVLEGMREAKGDICLVMDADLSHPPALVPKIIEAVAKEGFDVAIGSRLVKGGGVEDWPWYRRLISYGARMLARPITPVRDTMSGFFAIRKDKIQFDKIQPIGYKILLETLIKCRPLKAKEIPFTFRNREYGESKLGFGIYIDYLLHLARLYRHIIFIKKNPKESIKTGTLSPSEFKKRMSSKMIKNMVRNSRGKKIAIFGKADLPKGADIIIADDPNEKQLKRLLNLPSDAIKKGGKIILTTSHNPKTLIKNLKKKGFRIIRGGAFLIISQSLTFLPLHFRILLFRGEKKILPWMGSMRYIEAQKTS